MDAKRFAVLAGHRRALNFTLAPLPNGGVVGSAVDVTASSEAETRLQQHLDAHADTLDRLATAVAIFGPDRKLTFYNRAYVRLWGLPEAWLDAHPGEGEILDRLRELRRLPEQPDFRAWKQERLKLFERLDQHPEELWHLPGGKTLRVVTQPHPFRRPDLPLRGRERSAAPGKLLQHADQGSEGDARHSPGGCCGVRTGRTS